MVALASRPAWIYLPNMARALAILCALVLAACTGGDPAPPVHAEGDSCDDGLACTSGLVCKAIGDPCPTYPSCKVCYLPCGAGGTCPSGYRFCFPVSGQGGDVCIK